MPTLPVFDNTQIAFAPKTNAQLYQTYALFKLMNNNTLVNIGTQATQKLLALQLPVLPLLIKKTIFNQFCGAETLTQLVPTLQKLKQYNIKTLLDYAVEAKTNEQDFENTTTQLLTSIQYAQKLPDLIPAISLKITALTHFDLLQKLNDPQYQPSAPEQQAYEKLLTRLHAITKAAQEANIQVYIDAEESWIQNTLDRICALLMHTYNQQKPVIFNTIQLYRHDKLQFLKDIHQHATQNNYILAIKLVRGAYMEKERDRAAQFLYPSPISPTKTQVDTDFDEALQYCIQNIQNIAFCNASHNQKSTELLCNLIQNNNLPQNHPHIWFAQLYGMSDNLSYMLAHHQYNVLKYLPYGSVAEVMPYLIRRAHENTSVAGQVSRELQLIKQELRRRKLFFV